MLQDLIQDLDQKVKEDTPNGSIPMPKRLVPGKDGVVVKSILPHSDPWIDGVMERISKEYRISQAKRDATERGLECRVQFDRYVTLIEEYDELVVFLIANNLPFNVGQVLSIRGATVSMKIDRIEYNRHEASRLLVMRVYLLPVK